MLFIFDFYMCREEKEGWEGRGGREEGGWRREGGRDWEIKKEDRGKDIEIYIERRIYRKIGRDGGVYGEEGVYLMLIFILIGVICKVLDMRFIFIYYFLGKYN